MKQFLYTAYAVWVIGSMALVAQTVNVQSSGNTSVVIRNGRVKATPNVVIGSGNIVERTVSCKSIHTVIAEGSMDVTWVYSDDPSVVISGDDNIVNLFNIVGSTGTLRLNSNRSFVSNSAINVVVYSPTFRRFQHSGSGDIDIQDCSASDFTVEMKGSGDMRISGSVNNLRLVLAGSGDADATGCQAGSVHLRMTGSGDVKVSCSGRVSGQMLGAGDLTVFGECAISVINNGAGDIYQY
jgi:hypothetical protein